MIILREREFGNKANKAKKKAWEKAEAKKLGDKIFENKNIDLSPGDELRVFRLKQVVDTHGGVGNVLSSKDPSRDFKIGSDAIIRGERNINHKINSKSFLNHSDNPLGAVKRGDELVVNDLAPWRNKERHEILRTGGEPIEREVRDKAKEAFEKSTKSSKIKKIAPYAIAGTLATGVAVAGVKALKKKNKDKE